MAGKYILLKKNTKTTVSKRHVIARWVLSAWKHIKEDMVCTTWHHIAEAPAKASKADNDENNQTGGGNNTIQSESAEQANGEDTANLLTNNFLSQPMSADKQDHFGFLI